MEAEYVALYRDLYRNHWWWRVRERILLSTIEHLIAVPPVRILDVGCGDGLFFDALQRFGDVTGIEADETTLGERNPWADRIVVGELDESFAPREPFDLVLMLDVIEHVSDAQSLLRNAARVMKPGGRLLITVPALQWLWTAHDDMNHHVKRYTAGNLRRALQNAGLAVVEMRYLFQSLVLPKFAVRLSEMVQPRRPQLPHVPGPTVSAAIQSWCWTEYKVWGWLPFGTSVLAVAGLPRR